MMFLVKDDSLKLCIDNELMKFLRGEKFTAREYWNSYYGIEWVFVNINTKQYAYGKPGVACGQLVGDHAITIEEFHTIYNIYKKYEGKKLMEM